MRDHVHCSVVGTCLTDADLKKILERLKLEADPRLASYDLHAYFVNGVSAEGALARAVQKLLDRRYAGILRIVGQSDPDNLPNLWDREYQAGRISGAYWAFQTHAHVSDELHRRIFGEVHMLSHVLGRAVRADVEQVADLKARIADLEAMLAKQSQRHRERLLERDERIKLLEESVAKAGRPVDDGARGRQQAAAVAATATRSRRVRSDKQARALVAARERARAAEERVALLSEENAKLRRSVILEDSRSPEDVGCPGAAACRIDLPLVEPLRILYLGGRSGTVSQLKAIAEKSRAELLHHDGGTEENFHRIAPLIERCHVVFCPMDCVSHSACLIAKSHCKRLNKGFVTLRSSGQSTFKRALSQIVT